MLPMFPQKHKTQVNATCDSSLHIGMFSKRSTLSNVLYLDIK